MALPDDLSPDRGPQGKHPSRYNVHGYHLLVHWHGLCTIAGVAANTFATPQAARK